MFVSLFVSGIPQFGLVLSFISLGSLAMGKLAKNKIGKRSSIKNIERRILVASLLDHDRYIDDVSQFAFSENQWGVDLPVDRGIAVHADPKMRAPGGHPAVAPRRCECDADASAHVACGRAAGHGSSAAR